MNRRKRQSPDSNIQRAKHEGRLKPFPQPKRPQPAERPELNIKTSLRQDGSVEIDPQYNRLAIEHLDLLYDLAKREDYDPEWTDDHKVAFFMADMIDSVLAQYGPPIDQNEVDADVAPVPHIKESPVRDVYDLNKMDLAKPRKMPN